MARALHRLLDTQWTLNHTTWINDRRTIHADAQLVAAAYHCAAIIASWLTGLASD